MEYFWLPPQQEIFPSVPFAFQGKVRFSGD